MNAMLKLAIKEGQKKALPPTNKKKGGVGNLNEYKNAEVKRVEILKALKKGPMTRRDIAKKVGQNDKTTWGRILTLRDRGEIRGVGKRGAFVLWELVK